MEKHIYFYTQQIGKANITQHIFDEIRFRESRQFYGQQSYAIPLEPLLTKRRLFLTGLTLASDSDAVPNLFHFSIYEGGFYLTTKFKCRSSIFLSLMV